MFPWFWITVMRQWIKEANSMPFCGRSSLRELEFNQNLYVICELKFYIDFVISC